MGEVCAPRASSSSVVRQVARQDRAGGILVFPRWLVGQMQEID
jgi:hypothetical protein